MLIYSYDGYGRYTGFSGSAGGGETVVWDTNNLTNFSSFTQNAYGRVAYREENNCGNFSPAHVCLEMFSYTPSGRMTAKELAAYQVSNSSIALSLTANFGYDNEGRMTSITYPSGATNAGPGPYSYTFDAMGRPTGLSTFGSGAQYNAAGQLTQLTYGAGTESRTYNSLNQLTQLHQGAGVDLSYVYNTGTNNGQIAQTVDGAHGQSVMYAYDSLKRVSTAKASAVPYVLNQGFELTSISPWSAVPSSLVEGVNYVVTDVSPHGGTYSLTAGSGAVSQGVACYASATYTLTGYYKAIGYLIPYVQISVGQSGGNQKNLTAPESAWTAFTATFTAGSSCSLGSVVVGNGSFDDLVLTSSSTGSTNLLTNGGFEGGAQTGNWSVYGNARPTTTQANSGASSLLVPASGYATQVVYGCVPSSTYTVTAWYQGGTASLRVGAATAVTGSSTGWSTLSATGGSDSSGRLLITVSSATGTSYFDDLAMSTINVSNPTLTWGQQFGYDGFGNLLSQTVLAGSAPSMSLSVNPATNRVTGTGVTYDAAGNLTSNGTATFGYDELNRLISVGSLTYGYNGDNKRVVVYGSTVPSATLNLYGPTGQRLSSFTWQNSGTNWVIPSTGPSPTNYLYLGSKPLNYADDPVGSNASAAQYYPYGQVLSGSTPNETQAFGTYVQDESGLLYADQRYLYGSWGRFLTADPSDKNIDYGNPVTWNRYTYSNDDPVNGSDRSGLCAATYAGICDNTWCPPSEMSCGEYTLPPSLNPTPTMGPGLPTDLNDAYGQYASGQQALFMALYLQWYLDPSRVSAQQAQQTSDIQAALGDRLAALGVPALQIAQILSGLAPDATVGGHFNLSIFVDDLITYLGGSDPNGVLAGLTTGLFGNDSGFFGGNRGGAGNFLILSTRSTTRTTRTS